MRLWKQHATLILCSIALILIFASPVYASSSGLDTPSGVATLPIAVQNVTACTFTSNAADATQPPIMACEGRIYSGTNGTGGLWVNGSVASQFVGSEDSAHMGLFNNGWGLLLDNAGNVNIPGTLGTGGNFNAGGTMTVNGSLNMNANQLWNSAGDLYLNYSTPGHTVYVGANGNQNLSVPNGQICQNGTCINRIIPSGTNEHVTVSSYANAGTNYEDSESNTTAYTHDLCFLTGVQHSGMDSNCGIGGYPGGQWTVTAHSGIAGASSAAGQTNCAIDCYDWR